MVLNLDRSRQRYLNALEAADRDGWLGELTQKLIEAGALTDLKLSTPKINQFKVRLQKLLRPEDGFHNAADFNEGYVKARRRVCRIRAMPAGGGQIVGTGFLIAPQAVLTNWHVVEALTADGAGLPGSHEQLLIEFDVGGQAAPEQIPVAADWLISHSPYHASENPRAETISVTVDLYPAFADALDFAVVRLARNLAPDRGFYRLDPRYRARLEAPGSQVTLYQHPGGAPLNHSSGAAQALWPPHVETRLHHTANALPGSSGGLLLDAQYDPVGLHQSWISFDADHEVNCAIPTCCIVDKIGSIEEVSESDPALISVSGLAIIARDDLQRDMVSLASGAQRVLSLPDDPCPDIVSDLLATIVDASDHRIVTLPAEHISDDPRQFAIDLLTILGLDPALSAALPDAADRKTAEAAWVKDILLPPIAEALRSVTAGKTLWIVVSGMGSVDLFGRPRGLLLEQLLGRLSGLTFLRFVLIGHAGGLPAIDMTLLRVRRYRAILVADCKRFIRQFLNAAGKDAVSDDAISIAADIAFNFAPEPKEPFLARALPDRVRGIVNGSLP